MADAHKFYHISPKLGKKLASLHPRLDSQLQRASILLRDEVYAALAFWTTFFIGIGYILLLAFGVVAVQLEWISYTWKLGLGSFLAFIATMLLAYSSFFIRLPLRIQNRERDINAKLPYAINYLAAMSGSGGTPISMLKGLAKQEVYGEVQKEMAWIVRDAEVLGIDLLTALARAQDRSPSVKLQDFLQGISTNLSTGGDLDTYFQAKSEQYLTENRQQQESFIESLGVLAESFVTVVVAAPLLIVVLMSVMTTFSSGGSLTMGYILTLLVVPASQLGFILAINTMTPEA